MQSLKPGNLISRHDIDVQSMYATVVLRHRGGKDAVAFSEEKPVS